MESLITKCCSIRLLSTKSDGFIMWMILLMIFNSIVITPGNGLPMYLEDDMDEMNEDGTPDQIEDHYYTKRAWDKLQGGWGKRGWDQLHSGGWGKRAVGVGPADSTKILSILSSLQQNGAVGQPGAPLPYFIVVVPGGRADLEKRAWKNLQAGWGKRNNQIDEVQANQLPNDGNKGPAPKKSSWNNLKYMWG
ncbi:prothoracicostatic peptide isoform X2 [Chrysoperla carnea]|uniref:prothoracicostatic peptide isoform X2 n=1 Tax=Chrysoperla carnea TaxID=189513 RepID=UPI001D07355A|nr:prothoracicostatic peptide isoform X2 [Chrysoperla carnea]